MTTPVRFLTYLAPGLPAELFQSVVEYLEETLSLTASLRIESEQSGPGQSCGENPFETSCDPAATADFVWMCTPSYGWLRSGSEPAPRIVPAAWVFDDPRGCGEACYFSDVIVQMQSGVKRFEDLRGGHWAYNDGSSQSGLHNMLAELVDRRSNLSFFHKVSCSGSHAESLRLVAQGEVDAASIDSNVLALLKHSQPELAAAVRVIESWGPHPVQPLVAAPTVPAELMRKVGQALLRIHDHPRFGPLLRQHGVVAMQTVHEATYTQECQALQSAELLFANRGPASEPLLRT